jgi:excinuclease ABC subunit B
MYAAAEQMEFERAAVIRDRIEQMRDSLGKPLDSVRERGSSERKGRRGKKQKSGDPVQWKGRVPRPKRGM